MTSSYLVSPFPCFLPPPEDHEPRKGRPVGPSPRHLWPFPGGWPRRAPGERFWMNARRTKERYMNGQQSFRLPRQSLPATRPRPSSRSSLCLNAPKMPHAGAALQASRGRHANTFRPCTRRPAKSPCASGGAPWKGPETAPRGLALCGGETAAMVWKSLGATRLVAAAAAQMPPFSAQRPPVSVWVTPGPQPPAPGRRHPLYIILRFSRELCF